jgi:PGF-pre-PGF domain-containing protein
MVCKKGLKAVNRNEIILAVFVLGIVAFVFAMAPAANMTIPMSGGNYTGWINVSCYSGMEGAINASVYYNESGGAITFTPTYLMGTGINETAAGADNVSHINISVNTASFPDSTRYNISCTLCNFSTGAPCVNSSSFPINVTFDNTNPRVIDLTIDDSGDGSYKNGSASADLILNVSVNDSVWVGNGSFMAQMMRIESIHFNLTNSSESQINFTFANNHSADEYGSYYNASLNISVLPDGLYNLTAWINGTNMTNAGITSQINTTTRIQFTVDSNAPSATYTCSPASVLIGQEVTCGCEGSDSNADGTSGSGVNHTTDTTTTSGTSSIVTSITPAAAGTFERTCTVKDRLGNTASATASYTVTTATGGNDGTSSGTTSTSSTTTTTTAVVGNFEEDTAVEEIEVRVSAQVTNAEIEITRYEIKPAEISVAKSGEVYQYIQVETRNFADKLIGATMTIKVEKDWINAQGIAKEKVSLFKFNENSAEKWDELTTIYDREDAGYYYYDVELTSFSYFAISETVVVEDVPEPEEPETKNLTWLWITLGAVALVAVVIGGGFAVKKRR